MSEFLSRLRATVETYLSRDAEADEWLPVLTWQIDQQHALDCRDTYPGHLTTSAIILSADGTETLLIDHKTLKRWLQPGGHYEPAAMFWHSALREAEEETGLAGLPLHPWHGKADRPFLIDSHAVPGKASRGERPHLHHDLQFLFLADPASPLVAQLEEVSAVRWHEVAALGEVTPRGLKRLKRLGLAK
ncbi:MAG: NUDIX domain-containing protein [Methylobacterium sp.]|nr:NUDIX domain-containing protein [Methylobacterium sp.]MCA3602964.1 NUDIX domain-containing protein [Methylobacterium sp.]MCA3614672.1 NUDIX domain-containing protein [Methylobacterium sp.]